MLKVGKLVAALAIVVLGACGGGTGMGGKPDGGKADGPTEVAPDAPIDFASDAPAEAGGDSAPAHPRAAAQGRPHPPPGVGPRAPGEDRPGRGRARPPRRA